MKNLIHVFMLLGSMLIFTNCAHQHGQHKSCKCSKEKCGCGKMKSECQKGSCPMKAHGVSFVQPEDGATVKSPFKVQFAVRGMKVHPAGEMIEGTGHHHLIINSAGIDKGNVVPADEKHIHFGKGQTETTVELPKGQHTLTLQFADGAHISYGEKMQSKITVNVE